LVQARDHGRADFQRRGGMQGMKHMQSMALTVLLGLLMSSGIAWGGSQTSLARGAQEKAAEPATLEVEIVNPIPPVDRDNLKGYWTGVEGKTRERWMQILPAAAKPPLSTQGEVKIECWVHTDGRVTGMTLQGGSGNTALDRAAWVAITGSAPYDAFPYGIAVNQVKVRFTFDYNQGQPTNDKAKPK